MRNSCFRVSTEHNQVLVNAPKIKYIQIMKLKYNWF